MQKIATIIADTSRDQYEEEDAIRSAFKRWRIGGSKEIWSGDPEKTKRCACRLEQAMIGVAACRAEIDKGH